MKLIGSKIKKPINKKTMQSQSGKAVDVLTNNDCF